MKAIIKKYPEPGLWLEELPIPSPREGEVLIRVKKSSLCGTDLHIYRWDEWAQKNLSLPIIVGHEFMGEVAEVGAKVSSWAVGQRVTAEGHITCGHCPGCRHGQKHLCSHVRGLGAQYAGCFAEYCVLPAANIIALPHSISDNIGAILDPFGNAVHTALSVPLLAGHILITGAGPIGIMATAVAKSAGAAKIFVSDISPERLALARQMGATATFDLNLISHEELLRELSNHGGITAGMEMSGNPSALETQLQAANPGATVALLGLLPPGSAVDWDLIIFKMLTLKGIYGRQIFATWDTMLELLDNGLNLTPLITHQFSYEDFESAFALLFSSMGAKVILNWR